MFPLSRQTRVGRWSATVRGCILPVCSHLQARRCRDASLDTAPEYHQCALQDIVRHCFRSRTRKSCCPNCSQTKVTARTSTKAPAWRRTARTESSPGGTVSSLLSPAAITDVPAIILFPTRGPTAQPVRSGCLSIGWNNRQLQDNGILIPCAHLLAQHTIPSCEPAPRLREFGPSWRGRGQSQSARSQHADVQRHDDT